MIDFKCFALWHLANKLNNFISENASCLQSRSFRAYLKYCNDKFHLQEVFNCGSDRTSWTTSDNWFTVKSLSSLWRNVLKSPFLQERVCSRLKILPQIHLDGKYFSGVS